MEMTEIKKAIDAQGVAWEEFKKANDARLKAVEEKGYAPADTVAKVDTLNAELTKLAKAVDEAMRKMNRPSADSKGKQLTEEQLLHKSAIATYMRKGDKNMAEAEFKALSSQSDPDGGFLVSDEMDTAIDRVASAEVRMRAIANVRTVGKGVYKKLVKTRGVSGGWVGEAEDSQEQAAQNWAEISIEAIRQYAEPWIPNDLLEDADYDLEADVIDEAGITFGEVEGTAFINGSGVKQPRGILSYTIVANSSYAWGKVGYIASGGAGDFAASNPGDKIIDLQHSLRQRYRPGAAFLMNDSVLGRVRQLKDGSGNFYLWQPDPAAGFGGRILGSPVEVDDYMPNIAANSYSIAYGNFKRGYTIVDRRGIALIRDNVTKKGTTKFHLSRRVGGGITNFEAIKLFKFAAS